MKRIGLWIYIILLLVALAFGFLFNLENPLPVSVVLVGISLPEYSLGVWLLFSLFIGVLLGLSTSVFPAVKMRHRLSRLQKQNNKLEEDIKALRNVGLQD